MSDKTAIEWTDATWYTSGPFLVASPSSGPTGTTISLSGGGFRAGESVTVVYATGLKKPFSVTLSATTAGSAGTWTCDATIPSTSAGALGPHTITATGKRSKSVARTTFTLTS